MPDDAVVELNLDPHSAVVALTHDPKLDDLMLLEALKSPAFYVGALGSTVNSQRRRERLLKYFDLSQAEVDRLQDRLVAVLRPDQDALAALLSAARCEIVRCAEAERGMGHSLAAGVNATPDASGWVVALADMPFIASDSHRTVASCLRTGAALAATEYQGRRGHPVGFARQWFRQLTALTGDRGAKAILEAHQHDVIPCPVDDAGVLWDIDLPADVHGAR